ncbi:MAG TPA: gamma-glutamylcyclotransferase family protein, partial [Polyangia bacterium]|nr:gamma-glutamylcyclotransferase family protein [Polyangia bacterium]
MDAHHDQVARRRAELASSPPRLYFAYSTILDALAFDEWRTQHGYADFRLPEGRLAAAVDVDLVYDFPSRWWGGRVAGLVDKPGARIYGRVYEISGADWPILEHKEGAVTGM